MMNVSAILGHPKASLPFTANRSIGAFGLGGWTQTVTQITMQGLSYPSTEGEILMVPEGDRVAMMRTFLSRKQIFLSRNGETPGTSDQILYNGDLYRMVQLLDYSQYGYYGAIGARMAGD